MKKIRIFSPRLIMILGILFMAILASNYVVAQSVPTLSGVNNALKGQSTDIKTLAQWFGWGAFVLGAIILIFMFVQKKQDAKDYLTYYIIALVIWAVVSTLFLGASSN